MRFLVKHMGALLDNPLEAASMAVLEVALGADCNTSLVHT